MQQSFTSRESRAGERNGSEMDAGTGRAQDPPPGSLRVDLNVYFLYFLFFLFGQISLFNIRIELHLCSVLKYFCATLQPT